VIAQAIVMPVMGMGFFSSGILGGVTGRAAGDAQAVSRERRAA
jgi:hypothetical protein